MGHALAIVNGRAAQEQEVIETGKALVEYGLIRVVKGPWGYDFQLRPTATNNGIHSLDDHSATLRQIALGVPMASSTNYNQTFGNNTTIGALAQGSTVGSIEVTQSARSTSETSLWSAWPRCSRQYRTMLPRTSSSARRA